jgi:hypothetical protein
MKGLQRFALRAIAQAAISKHTIHIENHQPHLLGAFGRN